MPGLWSSSDATWTKRPKKGDTMSRPEPDPLDAPVRINTSISYFQWKECKKRRWKFSEVFKAGFGVLINGGQLGERIEMLEKEVAAYKVLTTRLKSEKRTGMLR